MFEISVPLFMSLLIHTPALVAPTDSLMGAIISQSHSNEARSNSGAIMSNRSCQFVRANERLSELYCPRDVAHS